MDFSQGGPSECRRLLAVTRGDAEPASQLCKRPAGNRLCRSCYGAVSWDGRRRIRAAGFTGQGLIGRRCRGLRRCPDRRRHLRRAAQRAGGSPCDSRRDARRGAGSGSIRRLSQAAIVRRCAFLRAPRWRSMRILLAGSARCGCPSCASRWFGPIPMDSTSRAWPCVLPSLVADGARTASAGPRALGYDKEERGLPILVSTPARDEPASSPGR